MLGCVGSELELEGLVHDGRAAGGRLDDAALGLGEVCQQDDVVGRDLPVRQAQHLRGHRVIGAAVRVGIQLLAVIIESYDLLQNCNDGRLTFSS